MNGIAASPDTDVRKKRSDTMAGEILLSSHLDRKGETVSDGLDLRGNEGLIIRLEVTVRYSG